MVKSRPGAVRLEFTDQVTLLASQFGKAVGLAGDGSQPVKSDGEQMSNWSSISSRQVKESKSNSVISVIPAEVQSEASISLPKFSTLGFEVDLTGSQESDTPFLLPKGEKIGLISRVPKHFHPILDIRKESRLKMKEDRFKKRRAERLSTRFVVNRLLHSARQRLLIDLSLMVPGSIEHIKSLDPSGNCELVWGAVQFWLEGQPELTARMNLTNKALTLIATYVGPTLEARSLQALNLYAVVVCKLDSESYRDLCSFLFPEDSRFSPQKVC